MAERSATMKSKKRHSHVARKNHLNASQFTGDLTLNGGVGIDLYDLQGMNNAEDLQLQRVSSTHAVFKRNPRGLPRVLELDTITMDAVDEFLISALGVDGFDSCTAPSAWTKVSC